MQKGIIFSPEEVGALIKEKTVKLGCAKYVDLLKVSIDPKCIAIVTYADGVSPLTLDKKA